MKKTISLAMIAIFLLSLVPIGIADNNGGLLRDKMEDIKDSREDIKDIREDIRDRSNIDRNRCIVKCNNENGTNCEARCKSEDLKENLRDKKEDLRDKMEDLRKKERERIVLKLKVRTAAELNARNISNDKLEHIRERYENASEKFKEAKDELKETREELRDAIKEQKKNETFIRAKNYLLKTSDLLINHLEKLKAKVQENPNIPNETEAYIVAEIDVEVDEVVQIKGEIEAATTREQLKDLAKELHDKWDRLKHLVKLHTYRIVAARIEGIVNFGLVLEKRLDKILDNLNDSGKNVSISVELADFKAEINASRSYYIQAQDKIQEIFDLRNAGEPVDSDKIKTLITETRDLLWKARDALKEAHQTLKTILRKIKQADSSVDFSSEVEVEVEQEA